MACNCGKKKISSQPKRIIKPQKQNISNTSTTKRIIRRAAR